MVTAGQRLSTPEALREEIRQGQAARTDLMRWKLLIVSGIGGVGLGLAGSGDGAGNSVLVLGVLPLACAYVDLLCWHLDLRMQVIGEYLRKAQDEYEGHVWRNTKHFGLEILATLWSSVAISALVGAIGIHYGRHREPPKLRDPLTMKVLVLASVLGTCLVVTAYFLHRRKNRRGFNTIEPGAPGG
jgi:hypothetical protein